METNNDRIPSENDMNSERKRSDSGFGSSLKSLTILELLKMCFFPAIGAIFLGITTTVVVPLISARFDPNKIDTYKKFVEEQPPEDLRKSRRLEDGTWGEKYTQAQEKVSDRTKEILEKLNSSEKAKILNYLSDRELLSYISLKQTSLQGADLSYLNLKNANLQKSNLKGTNLRGANLQGARLFSIQYDSKTRFDGATWNECTIFPDGKNYQNTAQPASILKMQEKPIERTPKDIAIEGGCRYREEK